MVMVSKILQKYEFFRYLNYFVLNTSFFILGKINEDYLRELLTTMGDRFTDDQVDQLFHDAPISSTGDFNYVEFTKQLKHGKKDPEDK